MPILIKPILFITDIGRCHPKLEVCGIGSKPFDFIWDDRLGAHVRRYESLEAFLAEQPLLIGRQKQWPVFFSVDIVAEGEEVDIRTQLEADLKTATERIRFLEAALAADEVDESLASKLDALDAEEDDAVKEAIAAPLTPEPSVPEAIAVWEQPKSGANYQVHTDAPATPPPDQSAPLTFSFPAAPAEPAELEVPPAPAQPLAPATPKSRPRR